MNPVYGRDLDLNLLRVFVVVADTGSVTRAAAQLYLTQPAVSAALRRLTSAIGAPLFAREGRGLTLTARGQRVLVEARPHLLGLVDAALSPAHFDAATSRRTLRIGLADSAEQWLLPALLRVLAQEAPHMVVVAIPVQFRNVNAALTTRQVDAAVTVADELPVTIKRQTLFLGRFVCLFDPRHARVAKTLSERAYFDHEHVIVSYNGDLRGVVEDALQKQRRVRCSLPSFHNVGAVIDGTAMLATVPDVVARQIRASHPHLRTLPLPFTLAGTPLELLWPSSLDADDACQFVRARIVQIASRAAGRTQPK